MSLLERTSSDSRVARPGLTWAAAGLAAMVLAAPAAAAARASVETPQGASADVPRTAVEALVDTGVSPAEARQRVATQDRKDALADQLTNKLGPRAAGAWIDQRSGRLVLNVTGEQAARQVRHTSAKPNIVDDSMKRLRDIKLALDRAGGAPGLSWGVDVRSNSVTVTVPRGADGAKLDAFLHKARSYGEAVRIERTPTAPRTLLGPGDAIHTSGGRCSAAFIGVSGGTEYVITAGHCTNIGNRWTTSGGQLIGTTAGSSFPGSDYGSIQVTGPVSTTNGQITQLGQPPVGSQVCKRGSTTGYSCGQIVAYNRTVNYPQGTVSGLIETTVCVQPGDSGGALFQNNTGVGITSGGSQGGCGANFQSFFQPAAEPFNAYGLQLKGGGGDDDDDGPPDTGTWQAGTSYQVGDQVTYNGQTYRCIQAHTAYQGWEPPNTPALWQPV